MAIYYYFNFSFQKTMGKGFGIQHAQFYLFTFNNCIIGIHVC